MRVRAISMTTLFLKRLTVQGYSKDFRRFCTNLDIFSDSPVANGFVIKCRVAGFTGGRGGLGRTGNQQSREQMSFANMGNSRNFGWGALAWICQETSKKVRRVMSARKITNAIIFQWKLNSWSVLWGPLVAWKPPLGACTKNNTTTANSSRMMVVELFGAARIKRLVCHISHQHETNNFVARTRERQLPSVTLAACPPIGDLRHAPSWPRRICRPGHELKERRSGSLRI
jgi:hypothetical protein